MKSNTSLAFGIDGVAPLVCTAKAEAAVAHLIAKAGFIPLDKLVIKYPK